MAKSFKQIKAGWVRKTDEDTKEKKTYREIKASDYDFGITDDDLKGFSSEVEKWRSTAQKDYDAVGYDDAESMRRKYSPASDGLSDRVDTIRAYLGANKSSMDEADYNSWMDYLDSVKKSVSDTERLFADKTKSIMSYASKADYNTAVREYGYYEKYKDMDAEARAEALKRLTATVDGNEVAMPGMELEHGWLKNYDAAQNATATIPRTAEALMPYEGITSKEDFAENSSKRKFNNPTTLELIQYPALYENALRNGVILDEKPVIEDKLGMYLSATEDEKESAYAAQMGENQWGDLVREGNDNSWNEMTEDEISTYYYLLNTEGQESAYKYLDAAASELNRRESEEYSKKVSQMTGWERIAANIASIPANIFGGIPGYIEDTVATFKGEEINPYSPAHGGVNFATTVRSDTAEKIKQATSGLEVFGQNIPEFLYQTGMSIADTAVGGSTLGRSYGLAMQASAATNKAKEVYEKGGTKEQVALAGFLAGMSELVFETISIDKLLSSKNITDLPQLIGSVLSQAGVEASEEMLTEIANTVSDTVILGENSNYANAVEEYIKSGKTERDAKKQAFIDTVADVLWAGIGGAISGGTLGGVYNTAQYEANLYDEGQHIIDSGSVDPLMALAKETAEAQLGRTSDRIRRLADAVQKDASARNVGRLSYAVDSGRNAMNEADLTKALVDRGMDEKTAADTAKRYIGGRKATAKTREAYGQAEAVASDPESAVAQRNKRYADIMSGRAQAVAAQETAGKVKADAAGVSEAVVESAAGREYEAPAVALETGETVRMTRFEADEDGNTVVRLENGEALPAGEVSFDSSELAPVYEAVVEMGVSPAEANALADGYSAGTDVTPTEYALGIRQAYTYGQMGMPQSQLGDSAYAGMLTEQQMNSAYELGRITGEETAKAADTAKRNAVQEDGTRRVGKVYFEGDTSALTERQKVSIETLGKVAEAIGVDIYLFESETDEAGRRIGANGWYDPSDNSIHIDIYAGDNGKGTILFTAAHELTHFIKEWSPAKYKVFSDFLMEQYGKKGVTVDELVQRQIEKAARTGRDLSYDEAFDEVVADACETMLTDSKAVEKIARLRETDKSLWNKIRSYFKDLLQRIKAVYDGLSPDSAEAQYVREMGDEVQRLYDLWTEDLADAGDVYGLTDVYAGQDAGLEYSARNYSYEALINKPDMTLVEINNVISYKPTKSMRNSAKEMGIKNAIAVGKENENGNAVVYVSDIEKEVTISKKSLEHGLDRRFSENLPATLKAGEILKNAIRINELTPDNQAANNSYILIGAAKTEKGDLSIVRFIVNSFSNEVESIDMLYALTTKKESAVLNAPPPANDSLRITDSKISIAQLLDYVNKFFPDILPESVLRYYGHSRRPDGKIGESALYSERNTDSLSPRRILANALSETVQNSYEASKLQQYKDELAETEKLEETLRKQRAEIKKMSFAPGKRDQAYRDKLVELRIEAQKTQNRLDIRDKRLLRLEATKPLQDLLARERAKVRKMENVKYREKLAEQRAQSEARMQAIVERNRESRDKTRARNLRRKIRERADRLTSTLLHPTDKRYVPAYLINAVAEVANSVSIGMDAPAIHEKGRYKGQTNEALARRIKTKEALGKLLEQYSEFSKEEDPVYAGEHDEAIEKQLKAFRDSFGETAVVEDLTLDQLRTLDDILRSISGTLMGARELIGRTDRADVYETGDAIMAEQEEVGKRKDKWQLLNKPKAWLLSPMRVVRAMAAYNEDSSLLGLFKDLEDGVRKKAMFMMNAYKKFEGLTTGKNEEKFFDATHDYMKGPRSRKAFTWKDEKGNEFSITKMQAMQAILTYEREMASGKRHISDGGLVFTSLEQMEKGKMKESADPKYSHKVTGPQAMGLIGELKNILANDSWAQEYMKAAGEFFNVDAKNAINEVTLQTKHRKIATEDNYIPEEVDKDLIPKEIGKNELVQQTVEGIGMLKDTNPNAANPLVITGLGNVLDRHIEEVATVYGLMIPLRNINKVWNVQKKSGDMVTSVTKSLKENWSGDIVEKIVEQAVRDVQAPRIRRRGFGVIKRNIIGSTFLLNLSVVLKQMGSYGYARSRLGLSRSIGIKEFAAAVIHGKRIADEASKYTATLWQRRQGLSDLELATLRHAAPGLLGKGLKRAGFKLARLSEKIIGRRLPGINPGKLIQWMDSTVAAALWESAKAEVKSKNPGLNGDALLEATAKFYDELIDNTQSVNDPLHSPEVRKSDNIVLETLSMFKNDAYQMAGDIMDAAGTFSTHPTKENGLRLYRSVEGLARSLVWTTAVTTLMALFRRKDEPYREEETGDLTKASVISQSLWNLAGEFTSILIPVGGSEAFEFVTSVATGQSYDIVENMSLSAINDLASNAAKLFNSIDELETEKDWEEFGEKTLAAAIDASSIIGIPTNNVTRLWRAIQLHIEDIKDGGGAFSSGVERTKKQNLNRVIKAEETGDSAEAKDIFAEVIDMYAEKRLEDLTEDNDKRPEYARSTEEKLKEDARKEALSDMKSELGDLYKDGGMEQSEAEMYLAEYFDKKESDIYWTMDKWNYAKEYGSTAGYSKYGTFLHAVSTGENLKQEIKRHIEHRAEGKSEKEAKSDLAGQITDYFKPLFLSASTTERTKIQSRCLTAYAALGYSREAKKADIQDWIRQDKEKKAEGD